jgi:TldD protein
MIQVPKVPKIDPAFRELPYEKLSVFALEEAKNLGASYADFRFERLKSQNISLHDGNLERLVNDEAVGYAVRLLYKGAWGFASNVDLSQHGAVKAVRQAVEMAKTLAALNSDPVELAPEPVYKDEFISSYAVNPFEVDTGDKVGLMQKVSRRLLDEGKVDHADFALGQVLENKYFANLDGSRLVQQRLRIQAEVEATKTDRETGAFETMRSLSRPVGKGWEYVSDEHDFDRDAAELPELLKEKMAAKSVEAGEYDLVIDPSNLWLTIHESIGHATELDRVLGYEANYAGTSFATLEKLGKLQYGSAIMNVTGDRVVKHGLSTVGYDDEGVKAQQWDLIKDGLLVGYQLNRQMAAKQKFGRSNGCAFADSPGHVPLQRMPNVSLQPGKDKLSTDDLIKRVERGIYIVGDKSWSIDMQRYNFQFTGQRFYEIKNGRVVGQLKDVAYQANTIKFWNSLEALGGEETYVLGGAFNCGKGQPGQVAAVSHGCPSALFRRVKVLNTTAEGGR